VIFKTKQNPTQVDHPFDIRIHYIYIFMVFTVFMALLQKKLSVPATVNRVLKYIPQLQEQVEGLLQKKEELLSSFSWEGGLNRQETKSKTVAGKSSSAVSAIWLTDREVSLQMTPYKSHNFSLSEILLYLEEYGLLLLYASSFESFGGRVFYNLHFQVHFVCFCLFLLLALSI
jgi:hypothetical protein